MKRVRQSYVEVVLYFGHDICVFMEATKLRMTQSRLQRRLCVRKRIVGRGREAQRTVNGCITPEIACSRVVSSVCVSATRVSA